jgi:hypothetical protein
MENETCESSLEGVPERKPGQISRVLERQAELLNFLTNVVNELNKRLEPINGGETPHAEKSGSREDKPAEPMVKVARCIQDNNDRIANQIERLQSATNRIEL